VASHDQGRDRLHQLVAIKAGLEILTILQIEMTGIGKDGEDVVGMGAEGTCAKSERDGGAARLIDLATADSRTLCALRT